MIAIFGTVILGILTGSIGWLATEFFAKPFRRGIDLVADVKMQAVMHGNVRDRAAERDGSPDAVTPTGISEADDKRLREAESEYRKLGAKLMAFCVTEPFAARCLKRFGYDIDAASRALIGLSNSVGVYGRMRTEHTARIEKSLSFKTE